MTGDDNTRISIIVSNADTIIDKSDTIVYARSIGAIMVYKVFKIKNNTQATAILEASFRTPMNLAVDVVMNSIGTYNIIGIK